MRQQNLHRFTSRDQARLVLLRFQLAAPRGHAAVDLLELSLQLTDRLVQTVRLIEGEERLLRGRPVFAEAAHHAAGGVALAPAGLFDAVHRAALGLREIARREARQRPAHALFGLAVMEQVLIGFVALVPHRLGEGRGLHGAVLHRLEDHHAVQAVQPAAGHPPLPFIVPGNRVLHRLSEPVAMRVAEAGEDRSRARHAKRGDQLAAQQAHRHRVEQHHAFSRERHHPAVRFEVEDVGEL